MLLTEHLRERTVATPAAAAVHDGDRTLTWKEVEDLSSRLANRLHATGVNRGHRVTVVLNRSVDWVPVIFGCLRTGAAYVPVDHRVPGARIAAVLEDCTPSAVVTDTGNETKVRTAMGTIGMNIPVLLLDEKTTSEITTLGSDVVLPDGAPDDLAYIMYTSGSTGTPKGVMVTHANVDNYLCWAVDYFSLAVGDRILGTAPFSSDMSTFDIYSSLGSGACLYIASEMITLFPPLLVKFVEKNALTVWKGVSSLFMYMCRAGVVKPANLQAFTTVMFAGEVLHPSILADWMRALPHTAFYNCYGPTEATGVSFCHRVDQVPSPGDGNIPLGKPCKEGTGAVILNEDGQLTSGNKAGELAIFGPCLSPGYWNNIALTKKAFIPQPSNGGRQVTIYRTGDQVAVTGEGLFQFLGRVDHQVKIMGYRVELGEIENCLTSIERIWDAVAIKMTGEDGRPDELCAFFAADGDLLTEDVRQRLINALPHYMVPARLMKLDLIPRSSRGKVSRKELECYLTREEK